MKELYFNSYDNQETNMVKFKKGDNIEGIENVLYKSFLENNNINMEGN